MFTVAKTYPITGCSQVEDRPNGIITDPNRCITYRTDTGEPLGVVSNDYQVLQPSEAEELVRIVTNNEVETRWSGTKMMYQAKISDMDLGNDPVNSNFLLVNSFDGSSSAMTMGSTFRLNCSNQLSMAFRAAKKTQSYFRITHNGNFDDKLRDLKDHLNSIRIQENNWRKAVSPLVNRELRGVDLDTLWKKAAPIALKLTGDLRNADKESRKIGSYITYCNEVFNKEVDELGCRPTLWTAANAVTHYVQHNLAKRGRKPDMDRRYVDCAIGLRASKTNKVMQAALEMV